MSRLISEIRTELRIIIKGLEKDHLQSKVNFKTFEKNGNVISLTNEISDSYHKTLILLREKAQNIGSDLSDDRIESILDDFLVDIMYTNTEKRLQTIEREIKNLFNKLKSINNEEHLFIVPLNHLLVSEPVNIGESEIFSLNEESLTRIINKYSLEFSIILRNVKEKVAQMNETNETSSYIVLTVSAPDITKAEEMAMRKADTSLNILRLFYLDSPFTIRDERRDHFTSEVIHVNLSTKTVSESFKAINIDTLIRAPNITKNKVEKMEKAGLTIINQLLSKNEENLSQLEETVLTSLFWFGNAMKEYEKDMKIIKLMTAIETILIPDGGLTKQHRLAARFTSILYGQESEEEKKEVYEIMKDLYKLRNTLLHSGQGSVYDEDLNQAIVWAQGLILKMLEDIREQPDLLKLLEMKYPIDQDLYKPNILENFLLSLSRLFNNLAQKISSSDYLT